MAELVFLFTQTLPWPNASALATLSSCLSLQPALPSTPAWDSGYYLWTMLSLALIPSLCQCFLGLWCLQVYHRQCRCDPHAKSLQVFTSSTKYPMPLPAAVDYVNWQVSASSPFYSTSMPLLELDWKVPWGTESWCYTFLNSLSLALRPWTWYPHPTSALSASVSSSVK